MTKREKIQEAYGEYWDNLKDYVSKNGWVETEKHSKFIRNHFYLSNNIETNWNDEIEFWRPKSIKGIEHNNGWINIESSEQLSLELKHNEQYFVIYQNGHIEFADFEDNPTTIKFWKLNFTHYRHFERPKPPIY